MPQASRSESSRSVSSSSGGSDDAPGRAEPEVLTLTYKVLERILDFVLGLLLRKGALRPLTAAERHTRQMLKDSIYARLLIGGYLSRGRGANRYPKWAALNDRLYRAACGAVPAGTGVTDAAFAPGLGGLVGEPFIGGNRVLPLINGPASFAERYALIASARQGVVLATWKVYGDHTGRKTVDALLARRREVPDLEVRVLIDGNVADRDDASLAQLKQLVDVGIPVLFYHHDQRPFDGFHYKELIVDAMTDQPVAITGGMNIGDEYSHGFGTEAESDPDRRRWRDTDIRIDGPAVRGDYAQLAALWNARVAAPNARDPFRQVLSPMALPDTLPAPPERGSVPVLTLIDEPGPRSAQKVTLAMLRAIRAARETIDIENAYFMDIPAIRRALIEAAGRGVRVRVLTNSAETVDETVVVVPILKGVEALLQDAATAGVPADQCQVHMRRKLHPQIRNGDTLHSKLMVVDRAFSQVASLNIHARSLRLEVEGAHYVLDPGFGAALADQFEQDLTEARRCPRAEDIAFPTDLVSRIMRRVDLAPVLA